MRFQFVALPLAMQNENDSRVGFDHGTKSTIGQVGGIILIKSKIHKNFLIVTVSLSLHSWFYRSTMLDFER